MATCTGCKYKQEIPALTGKHNLARPEFCLRYPPTPQFVMQQDKFGTQQPGTVNIYPTINDETPACGEYQKNSALDS